MDELLCSECMRFRQRWVEMVVNMIHLNVHFVE